MNGKTFKSLAQAMQELASEILREAAEASADLSDGLAHQPRRREPEQRGDGARHLRRHVEPGSTERPDDDDAG